MAQRGKRSAVAKATLKISSEKDIKRPEAPRELIGEEVDEWNAIVNELPHDWFTRESWGLLVQYCRHVARARRIAELIDEEDAKREGLNLDAYDKLLSMQVRESRVISMLSTKMRLAQQSTLSRRDESKKVGKKPVPWEA
jgi:hypothetical protein